MKSDGNGDDIAHPATREPVVDWPDAMSGVARFGSAPAPSPFAPAGDILLPGAEHPEASFEEAWLSFPRTLH